MAGQGAGLDVGRLRARMGPLVVPAVVEPPVPTELRARRALRQRVGDLRPTHRPVLGDVPGGDRIGDPLEAQGLDQPVEQRRRVMVPDGADDAMVAQVLADIGKIRCRPGKAARGVHHLHGVREIGIGK